MGRRETKSYPIAGLKSVDTDTGTFEAIVSVFGNVDLHGHRIAADAFDKSLQEWKESGDPVPVIFSHQWDNLNAYLGVADPDDIRALPPGDPDLPAEIADFGGLYVKASIDTTEPEGRKAIKLLKSRAIREFSFAYDVFDEAKADDGFLDLLELGLIEIGPTLRGANQLTQLIGAKAASAELDEAFARVAEVFNMKASDVAELVAALDTISSEDEAAPSARSKAFVTLAGTLERLQESLDRAAKTWAAETFGDNFYGSYIEGTFTDTVVFYVELWDDPPGAGRYFEASYSATGDDLEFGEPTAVEFEVTVNAKAAHRLGVKAGARNAAADLERIQGIHDLTAELGAACAEPDGTSSDDDDDEKRRSTPPGILRATLEADLLELGTR